MEDRGGAGGGPSDGLAELSITEVLQQTSLPAAVVTRKGEFAFINSAALAHLGSPGRKLSKQYNAFTLPTFRDAGIDEAIRETFLGEKVERPVDYVSMWGRPTKAWIEYIPLHDRDGTVWAVLLLIHPATAPATGEPIRKLKSELETAKVELKHMHELQQRFIAMVSHELRTPLVPLLGYLQMLEKRELGELTGRQEKAVGVAARGAKRLLKLVEKVLAMSRGTGGEKSAKLRPVDPCRALREAYETMLPLLERSGLTVRIHCQRDIPEVVSNRAKLVEIITTLLDNAQKFADEGGRIELAALRSSDDRVALVVANTGKKIRADDRERIFDYFYQAEPPGTRSRGGLGLGLTIARETLTAQGGSIEVVDWKGFDAAFRIELPAAPSKEAGKEPTKWPTVSYRVLMADPDPERRKTVLKMTEILPASFNSCANAEQAREIMSRWPPTVLLLSLEDETAMDLVRSIRSDGKRRLLPIVMLARPQSENLRRPALDAGATAVLTDPMDEEMLLRIFRSIYPSHF
jgi:signal transduction histidine kinase